MPRPFTRLHEPWAFVRHFTPNWFAMTMGTGVMALVLAALPWDFPARLLLAEAVWVLALLLFGLVQGVHHDARLLGRADSAALARRACAILLAQPPRRLE